MRQPRSDEIYDARTDDGHAQPHDRARGLHDPSWRYTRAVEFIDAQVIVIPGDEDVWVKRLVCFLRACDSAAAAKPELARSFGPRLPDLNALERSDPNIFWAHTIFTRSYSGPRYQLEALLLTNLSDVEIEHHLAVPAPVASAYENCFFDMRQYLDRPEAIRASIDARARVRGVLQSDPDVFWKRAALDHGPALLMALWGTGALTSEQSRQIDAIIASQARRLAIEAQRIRTVNAANAHEFMKEYANVSQLEMARVQQNSDLGRACDPAQEIAAGLFEAIQYTLAPMGRDSERASVEVAAAFEHAPKLLQRMHATAKDEVTHEKCDEV